MVGKMIEKKELENMKKEMKEEEENGGKVKGGERVDKGYEKEYYVRKDIVEMKSKEGKVIEEKLEKIIYVMKY